MSDLHAQANTDYASRIWAALARDLESLADRIDLLAVTGDLIDNPWRVALGDAVVRSAYRGVRDYVTERLCKTLRLEPRTGLIVVPGNHDYSVQGLVRRRAHPALFREFFSAYAGPRIYPSLRLACFTFDSNSDDSVLNLATGLVPEEALITFAADVERLERSQPEWAGWVKVALVHHHPMPIGPTEHRESIVGRPEHMLLKNAGVFLAETVKARIDLVLHGHQHYPALSKASYPIGERGFHTLSVVGAGSAGVGDPCSYYLVTLTDAGEALVEERVLTDATYVRRSSRALVSLDEARPRRIEALAAGADIQVRVDRYTRLDRIEAGSGDDHITEYFGGMESAAGGEVAELPHAVTSRSGSFHRIEYVSVPHGQEVTWEWLDPKGRTGRRQAKTLFNPPLRPGAPINVGRRVTAVNAFHFNRRDRLDATDEDLDYEYLHSTVPYVCELLTLQAVFPEGHWPGSFRVDTLDAAGRPDRPEADYAQPGLSVLDHPRTVCLSVHRPLPGYAYRIVWRLPDDESTQIGLDAVDAGKATELIARLLAARVDRSRREAVERVLDALRQEIERTPPFQSPTGPDETLEVGLLCYDGDSRGLVAIGAVGHAAAGGDLAGWVVKPGRGVEGQAYRRREHIVSLHGDSEYYEDLPDSTLPRHTVVVAIMLPFPVQQQRSRRIAVLRVASRSNTSGLLQLGRDQAARLGLVDMALGWFARDVGPAVGLGTLH